MKRGRRSLSLAGGAVGLVLRAQGAGQAGWHLLPGLLPTGAAGSSLEGDVPAPGPPGDTTALRSEPLACLSVPAPLSHPGGDLMSKRRAMNIAQQK